MPETDHDHPFSAQLEAWLRSDEPKTLASLASLIHDKGFALVLMLLMFVPALPAPTGGVTHVFEIVAMFVALQLVIGRRTLWLPARARRMQLGAVAQGKVIPFVIRRVRSIERFARPRLAGLLATRSVRSLIGVVVLLLVVGAFVAPPFSGLDTLPALGVVVISLGLLFDDALVVGGGIVVGAVGIALEIVLGTALWRAVW